MSGRENGLIMYRARHIFLTACILLSACGDADSFREKMGLNRKGPDEFQVYARPPLTVPPDFNLRPPKSGAEYTPGVSVQDQAHNKVIGAADVPASSSVATTAVPAVSSAALPSNSDSQFLSNAGADKAQRNIRQVLLNENESGIGSKDSRYLFTSSSGDSVVDPAKEADRLKKDKASNKPPTEGETPVIAPQSKGILGDLF